MFFFAERRALFTLHLRCDNNRPREAEYLKLYRMLASTQGQPLLGNASLFLNLLSFKITLRFRLIDYLCKVTAYYMRLIHVCGLKMLSCAFSHYISNTWEIAITEFTHFTVSLLPLVASFDQKARFIEVMCCFTVYDYNEERNCELLV